MIDIYEIVGLLGVGLSIYGYARVQWQRDFAKRLSYSMINLVGALLYSVSLFKYWNLPSFVSNMIWGLISLYGAYRCYKYIRRDKTKDSVPASTAEQ